MFADSVFQVTLQSTTTAGNEDCPSQSVLAAVTNTMNWVTYISKFLMVLNVQDLRWQIWCLVGACFLVPRWRLPAVSSPGRGAGGSQGSLL